MIMSAVTTAMMLIIIMIKDIYDASDLWIRTALGTYNSKSL